MRRFIWPTAVEADAGSIVKVTGVSAPSTSKAGLMVRTNGSATGIRSEKSVRQ